jgi:hypothetical protein
LGEGWTKSFADKNKEKEINKLCDGFIERIQKAKTEEERVIK